jgi:cell division protease FtsH
VIDEEISKLIETQYQRAVSILTENRDKLDALAQKLLDKEVIFREDLEEIFGKSLQIDRKTVSSLDNPADAGNVLNTES